MPSLSSLVTTPIGVALSPPVAAGCLAYLKYAPQATVQELLAKLGIRNIAQTKLVLGALLGLGLVRSVNRLLTKAALNHWSLFPRSGWEWSEEVAVVTGGCSGIGQAVALGLVDKGITVAVLDVQDLPKDMASVGKLHHWKCNLGDPEAVSQVADSIRSKLGHPSILVQNAGIAQSFSVLDTPSEYLQKLFAVNTLSLWYTTKAFLPSMVARNKGHIVTVASVASYMAMPGMFAYSASKSAATAFHDGLGFEIRHLYKSAGVLTTQVNPMWVRTNMTEKYASKLPPMLTVERVAEPIVAQILSRRGGHLIVPEYESFISKLKGLPTWLHQLLGDIYASDIASSYQKG